MSFTAIVPARWQSSRFPGKPLVDIGGLPMVVRTALRAAEAETIDRVVVATDDRRVSDECQRFGVEAIETSSEHATGTDRVVEASRLLGVDKVVNVQGDEPLIDPAFIDHMVRTLTGDSRATVANTACLLPAGGLDDPNIVKVVVDQNEHVMALSRLPIPFSWGKEAVRLRHLGLYAFRGDALENFTSRVRGPLEQAERIEMYRFLEYGDAIVLAQVDQAAPAVDVPEDVEKIRDYL